MKLEEIVQRAEDLGLEPIDLDERVHTIADGNAISDGIDIDSNEFDSNSHDASEINNGGLNDQLSFIFFGETDIEDKEANAEEVEQVLQEIYGDKE